MRPWNEIIAEARDRNKDYTLDEFCDVYERYYEPTEKLPGSGKTPNQKNRNKANQFRQSNKTYIAPGYDDDGEETGPERAGRLERTYDIHKKTREVSAKEQKKRNRLSPEELKLRERDVKVRERHQTTREQEAKRKGAHSKWVIDQAQKNAEERKKKQLKDIKDSPRKAASAALSSISKPQSISYKDSDATAYTKAIGNVGSLFGGVAKAGIHYGIARHKAKKEASEIEGKRSSPIPLKAPKPPKPPTIKEKYFDWREELLSENNSIENLHEFLPALLAALEAGGAAEAASVASGAGRAAAAGETGLGSKVSNVIKKTVKNKLGDGDNSSNSQSSSSSSEEPISSNDSSATAYTKALSNVGKIFSREEFVAEVEDKEAKRKKIIDVMRGKNKVELNPNMKEEKDQEGGMAHNELATMERAVKTLRKKIKSPNQQLPAWVQSKISKAADHIDTVADYMSGETEPVSEGYDDEYETFRQHSREPFSSLSPSERINRTAGVLKLMKQVNADVEKPKKKKKKKNKDVTEECGCEDDKKKVLAMMIIKKAIDAKKKKNFQLNSGIIGEESAAWQRKEGKNPEGGLNKKGIASYRREHPGSHLSLAVTTEPSKLKKGSKAANRRKSFCARMGGMPGPMKDEKGRPTRKALSLRKWNC